MVLSLFLMTCSDGAVWEEHTITPLSFLLSPFLFCPSFFTDPPLFFSLIPFVAIPTHRPVTTDVF
jgi:hypothetical protein